MKLDINYLTDEQYVEYPENFKSCYNARGLYDSMQFVLRLRPDLHALLDKTEIGIHHSNKYDFETIQAFSTYLHETVHWWQHIGSISGLILSFSYPSQSHINRDLLLRHIGLTGLVKPVLQYNENNAKDFRPTDDEFIIINQILNNFHDIEFFKVFMINPKSGSSVVKNKLFESIGHSYHIAYSSFINLISSTFDRELIFLPNTKEWHVGFKKATDNKITGYYYGSDVYLSPIGEWHLVKR